MPFVFSLLLSVIAKGSRKTKRHVLYKQLSVSRDISILMGFFSL